MMDQLVTKKHLADSGLNVTYLPYIMNIGYELFINTAINHKLGHII